MQDDFDNGTGMGDDDLTGSTMLDTGDLGAGGHEGEGEGGEGTGRRSGGARARKSSGSRKSGGRKAAGGGRKSAAKGVRTAKSPSSVRLARAAGAVRKSGGDPSPPPRALTPVRRTGQ